MFLMDSAFGGHGLLALYASLNATKLNKAMASQALDHSHIIWYLSPCHIERLSNLALHNPRTKHNVIHLGLYYFTPLWFFCTLLSDNVRKDSNIHKVPLHRSSQLAFKSHNLKVLKVTMRTTKHHRRHNHWVQLSAVLVVATVVFAVSTCVRVYYTCKNKVTYNRRGAIIASDSEQHGKDEVEE